MKVPVLAVACHGLKVSEVSGGCYPVDVGVKAHRPGVVVLVKVWQGVSSAGYIVQSQVGQAVLRAAITRYGKQTACPAEQGGQRRVVDGCGATGQRADKTDADIASEIIVWLVSA